MGRKQRKQERKRNRSSRQQKIQKLESLLQQRSITKMNDFCSYMFEKCGDPRQEYNFDCFGDYKLCRYYEKLNQ